MMMMMMMMCCSNVNFANAPPDSIVNVALGLCHIEDPTPPPPTLPTDGALTVPTIPTGMSVSPHRSCSSIVLS